MRSKSTTEPAKICIIGAGISGLAKAWILKNRGAKCTLLEQADYPGGALRSYRDSGYLAEEGPHSIQMNTTAVEGFLNSIPKLKASIVESRPNAKKRFIVRNGKLHEVPLSPLAAITTPLWSLKGKLFSCFEFDG